jgi:hypothetical protein
VTNSSLTGTTSSHGFVNGIFTELRLKAKDLRPVLIVILAGNIVLRNLVRGHFGLVRIRSIFHTADDPSLERLPFFEQLLCALRIHVLKNGNALKVSRSLTGARSQTFRFQ